MRFLVLFCALMAWSAKADAAVIDNNFRLNEVGNVIVHLADEATGACWTNLKEVREYAEEKLRMKGVKVTEKDTFTSKTYILEIAVSAMRYLADGSGGCVGYIRVHLSTYARVHDIFHNAIAAANGTTIVNPQNFNRYTIEAVSDLISELK